MAQRNPTRSTRLPDGLDDEFTEFKDSKDMTSSEALRTLIRDGLAEKRDQQQSRVELIEDGLPAGIVLSFVFAVLTGVWAITVAVTTGAGAALTPAVLSVAGALLSILLVDVAKRLDARTAEKSGVEA